MWFTETPWPPMAICAVAAVLLVLAWFRNARNLYLFGAVGLCIAAAAIFFIEQAIVTELETVELMQEELAEAVRRDDVETVVGFLSESQAPVRLAVRLGMATVRIDSNLEITDTSFRWTDDGKQIIAHFRANGQASLKSNKEATRHFPTRWEFTWEKNDAGEWKVVRIDRLNPVNGESISMMAPP